MFSRTRFTTRRIAACSSAEPAERESAGEQPSGSFAETREYALSPEGCPPSAWLPAASRRVVTARAWASRPSAAAIAVMVGARPCKPSREISCKVILRRKLSRFTPLNDRAQPLVGRVWFVPEA